MSVRPQMVKCQVVLLAMIHLSHPDMPGLFARATQLALGGLVQLFFTYLVRMLIAFWALIGVMFFHSASNFAASSSLREFKRTRSFSDWASDKPLVKKKSHFRPDPIREK